MQQSTAIALSICFVPLLASIGLINKIAPFGRWPFMAVPMVLGATGAGLLATDVLSPVVALTVLVPAYQMLIIGPFVVCFRILFRRPLPAFPTASLVVDLGYALLIAVLVLPPIIVLKALEVR